MTTKQSATAFETVFNDERNVIKQQRLNRGDNDRGDLTGFAISGGGIRSASFALGVLQGLAKYGKLRRMDYLSTVSGGGYIGASLTWFNFLNKQTSPDWQFPFMEGEGARQVQDGDGPLNFLRQHGNYLLPNGISALSLLGVSLRNMTLGFSVYLAVIVAILYLFIRLNWLPSSDLEVESHGFSKGALLTVMLFGATTFLYALLTWLKVGTEDFGYRWRVKFQKFQGLLIGLALAFGFLALLPLIHGWLGKSFESAGYMTGSLPAMLGVAGSIYEFFQQQKGKEAGKGSLSELRILLTSLLLIFGILVLGYKIALDWDDSSNPAVFGMVIMLVMAAGWFVNINLFGIGRMDRDRLMEAFLPDPQSVKANKWNLAKQADVAFFKNIAGEKQWGPYHIINANVVLVDADQTKFRGRGGDNFILSGLYCGGDAVGFHPMSELEGGEITLATAVSISGAALNPNAANSGQGATRNRLVSFILAFLNIRLGFWVRNPAAVGWRRALAKHFGPNFFHPGFLQGLLGQQLNEHASFLELTDGGHFDNTGLYELIRRRVDTIYFSSAGADPKFTLDDIGNVLVRIQVDFGVTVEFADELEPLMPGTETESPYGKRFNLSRSGVAEGKIHYPETRTESEKWGLLYIVRAALVKDLPPQIYSYRAQHEEFPHQSTADQFFDEPQLEAYRELGFRLTEGLLSPSGVK
jgi:hypothetical protein